MENAKIQSLSKDALLTAILVGAATMAPLLHSQLVTGTIVNAALFVAAMTLGFGAAASIAVFPSLIALGVGTLPLPLAPMVPFIVASNIALVAVFMLLKNYSYLRAAVLACLAKFLFLVSASAVVLKIVAPGMATQVLSTMMGWPQLITALLGGIAAYVIVSEARSRI